MKRVLLVLVLGATLLLSGCYGYVRPVGYYGGGYYEGHPGVNHQRFHIRRSFGTHQHRGHRHHHFGENPGPEGEMDESLFTPVEQWRVE